MVNHRAKETLNLRIYSVDWRNFVIQSYVYLRDAERKSYVDETMYESLLFKLHQPPPEAPYGSQTRDRTPAADLPKVCSYCNCPINKAHPGGHAACVFSTLDATKAKEAGKKLLAAIAANPRLDKVKKIKDLIEEMGVDK